MKRSSICASSSSSLLFVALLICQQACVDCLRRPMRSVRRCDHKSPFVAAFNNGNDCRTHCQEAYIRVNLEMVLANERLFQAYLEEAEGNAKRARCCCVFEAPWPAFVRPKAIGRAGPKTNQVITRRPNECLPLVMSINLSKRTKVNYEVLCRYYIKQEPLTMLELLQFAEAAAYLNYMRPKHPSIRLLLRNKMIARIEKVELAELRRVFYTDLLDTYLPLEFYDGHALRVRRFRRFLELKRELQLALKSAIVARAFDELIISNMMMDVAAAEAHLKRLSAEQLRVPGALLAGNYDKYDQDLSAYFSLPGVDCKLLADTNNKLQTYLAVLKALSEALSEKLVYEHMSEDYPQLAAVLETQRIYKNLHKVNCAAQARRG